MEESQPPPSTSSSSTSSSISSLWTSQHHHYHDHHHHDDDDYDQQKTSIATASGVCVSFSNYPASGSIKFDDQKKTEKKFLDNFFNICISSPLLSGPTINSLLTTLPTTLTNEDRNEDRFEDGFSHKYYTGNHYNNPGGKTNLSINSKSVPIRDDRSWIMIGPSSVDSSLDGSIIGSTAALESTGLVSTGLESFGLTSSPQELLDRLESCFPNESSSSISSSSSSSLSSSSEPLMKMSFEDVQAIGNILMCQQSSSSEANESLWSNEYHERMLDLHRRMMKAINLEKPAVAKIRRITPKKEKIIIIEKDTPKEERALANQPKEERALANQPKEERANQPKILSPPNIQLINQETSKITDIIKVFQNQMEALHLKKKS